MVHLHVHTMYSLLDSNVKIDELFEKLKELGQDTIAITDHGYMYGCVDFYKKAKENGIKPIIGCECYICDDVNEKNKESIAYHLLLLAKNETGRLNLQKLVKESTLYMYRGKPRIDWNMLVKYHEGLICCSACMAGEVSRLAMNNKIFQAKQMAMKYKELFKDDYYIEYQSHANDEQMKLNKQLVEIANSLDIKYIVTCDVHYLTPNDQKYHSIFVQIGQSREVGETYNDCYLQSEEEVKSKCTSTREYNDIAIQNTHEIANKCTAEYPLSAPIIPHVTIPSGFKDEEDYLRHLCNKGYKEKKINLKSKEKQIKYKQRAKYELDSVLKMGFEGYYLLVYSYIMSAKRRGIGRGSAGGSLLAYLMGITDIDPIEYGLYFERFIDVGALDLLESGEITRKQLKIPDVDTDFSPRDRDKVMQYIINTYGDENVVSLGQFGYIWAKGAIKDIGKVLNIPFNITNKMTKNLGDETIDEALENGVLDEYKEDYPELFEYASKLAGLPKSFGMHPCFPSGTLVMTNKGYKEIQNIRVGDKVLTHKNKFKLVAKNMSNTTNKITTIDVASSLPIQCTNNHPFYVRHRDKGKDRKYSNPEWVNACDVIKTDMLCMPINKNSIIPNYKSLKTEEVDFWWIVGRFIGDGWCEYIESRNDKRVIICCNKNNEVELNDIINKLKKYFEYRYIEEDTTYKIHIKNKDFFNFLLQFGKYAHGKFLTDNVLDLPVNLLKGFLEGYFSADGYERMNTDEVSFKTVSKELAYGMIACIAKVYHKHCNISKLEAKEELICGRSVHSKEKYIVIFKKEKGKKDRSFYDENNNCLWLFVKEVKNESLNDCINTYNLSVVDDNSYTVNNIAVHNCGKCISMTDAVYYNALSFDDKKNVWVLQGDMHTADDLGLVKIDLLGLRTLDVIYDVLELIGKTYEDIAPHNINFNDELVWNEFKNGNTSLIFQFESQGMQKTLRDMKCDNINDLGVANALYRPGAMKYISNYVNRKNGTEEITYLHDDLKSILAVTYGIIVYQEQLIEIGRLAKLKNPDELRQATAKKKPKLMAKIEPELKNGLIERGWTKEQVDNLWNDILAFARYSFNKSHSQAYAITAYISMFMKVHYPVEYICAYINSYDGDVKGTSKVLQEAIRMGVKFRFDKWCNILPYTTVKNDTVLLGINTLKEFGSNVSNALIECGKKQYNSFIELINALTQHNDINTSQISNLIKLNMFSEFGKSYRLSKVYELYEKIYNRKTFDKSKLPIDENILKKYARETEKQYRDIDNLGLFNELCLQIEDKDIPIKEQLNTIFDLQGIVNYVNPKLINYYFVLNIDTKYSPKVTIYCFENGETKINKINKKIFSDNPINIGDIIKVTKTSTKNKSMWNEEKQDYDKIENEYDEWINRYVIK